MMQIISCLRTDGLRNKTPHLTACQVGRLPAVDGIMATSP